MLLEPHPQLRLRHLSFGSENAPVVVIDALLREPERLLRKAARLAFLPQGALFPGVRARAPLSYEVFIEGIVRPLLGEVFGLPHDARLAFPMCHYSLVTQPPERLEFLQRIPHIDSTTALGLATVHYLFRAPWGGTAFYRHRGTGFETIDDARRDAYYAALEREAAGEHAPGAGYIDGDTALFERIGNIDGVFNRMIVYRRNALHSGNIDNRRVPPADLQAGRLSINSFIDVKP